MNSSSRSHWNIKEYDFEFSLCPRLPTAPCDLSEYRRSAPGPHGLAKSPQKQGGVLCQEGEGPPPRGHGGTPKLDVLWRHSPKSSR